MYRFKFLLLPIIAIALVVSCKKKKDPENPVNTDFNKASILQNLGTNLIIPNYERLNAGMIQLEIEYNTFVADQTPSNFMTLQEVWKNTYANWEKSLMYEFGPAMEQLFKTSVGTFPTDSSKIVKNIENGTYDLSQVSNATAQGLPAFDFLLYRNNAISYFSDTKYAKYGSDLIAKMKTQTATILNAWKTSYIATFTAGTGTETTSPFSQLINEFVKSYEECKWTKIGIPTGHQSLGIPLPNYVETRRAKIGFTLMLENIEALQRLFNGNQNNGVGGIGFDDYLVALGKTELATKINTEFDGIVALINAFTVDLETAITTNPAELDALYTKVHNLTASLKTDMTSAFGVMITYQDNDGD